MIVRRSEKRKQNARKKNAIEAGAKLPPTKNSDDRERNIGNHVPEVRNAPDRAAVREAMIRFVLRYRRHEEKERQYCERRSRDEQTGTIRVHDQFPETG